MSPPRASGATPSTGPKRPLLIAVGVVVLVAVVGVGWWALRPDPFGDAARDVLQALGDDAVSSCAEALAIASSGEDLVELLVEEEGDRAVLVENLREMEGLPADAASWGWSETEQFLHAFYAECKTRRDAVAEWRQDSPSRQALSECQTELAAVKTAIAAARTANEVVGNDEDPSDYLDDLSPVYYTWTQVGPGDWEPEPIGDPPC